MSTEGRRFGLVGRLASMAALGALLIGMLAMFTVDRYATRALLRQVEEGDRGLAERVAIGLDDQILRTIAALKREAQDEDLASLDRDRATDEMAAGLRAPSEYAVLTLLDRAGRPVASAASAFLADPADLPTRRDLVDEVRARGSGVRLTASRAPVLEIAVPVESPPGTMVGVLVADLSLELLGGAIASFRVGPAGTASLIDPQGRTLVHRDRGRVVRRQRVAVTGAISGPDAFTVHERRGGSVTTVAVAPTRVFPGAVALEQRLSDATLPVSGARRGLMLIVLLSVVATAGAIAVAGRRVLAPLRGLAVAVRDLGAGVPSARAPTPRHDDEIGLLSEQFNRMAGALEERMAELSTSERRATEAQQRLDDAFAHAPIGMAMLALDGTLQRANQALIDLLGYPEHALVGMTFQDLTHPADPATPVTTDEMRSREMRISGSERRFVRGDGASVWVLLNVTVVNDALGVPVQFFAQMQDITTRKAAEEELRRLDRAKSEFVANAAHELRTPLTALSGFAELLTRRGSLPPEALVEVDAGLQRQSARARVLVERMLDLLRIESGAAATTLQPLSVTAVVDRALAAAPAPGDRTVELAIDPDAVVIADDVALEQVLSNLLVNAYRYGGKVIAIRTAQQDGFVQIAVEDDGVGVSGPVADHLFEPFNRGADASAQGSGLGLAIVRRLMASMEGSITHEQRAPNGTRFVLRLRGHRGPRTGG